MNIHLFPTSNVILNIFIRSMVMFVGLVFGGGVSFYNAYWVAVVHDTISLILIRNLV